ncbi:hypothetical protein [Marinobacterium stanieri]|uniref:Uncharacterized protein n=1 Tax=Marinobacterium stanieri TaxID=49186 RepID=A0A1N6X8B1_9GAMM|nr:hypothetical protein [Marinobacterium stanieri]SIQ98594.1 hypothetical protein SAMN05421647_11314 [Marinobacterium stanieri]
MASAMTEQEQIVEGHISRLKWWITAQPTRFLGMSGEPFAAMVLIPVFPFPGFIKFVMFLVMLNIIMSLIFRKTMVTFLIWIKRQITDNRMRVYSVKDSKARFNGYY